MVHAGGLRRGKESSIGRTSSAEKCKPRKETKKPEMEREREGERGDKEELRRKGERWGAFCRSRKGRG